MKDMDDALKEEVKIIQEGNPVDASGWENVQTEMKAFEQKIEEKAMKVAKVMSHFEILQELNLELADKLEEVKR